MMKFHYICLVLIAFCYFLSHEVRNVHGAALVSTRRRRDTAKCAQRCDRIFERSLRRIGESRETLQALLDKQRPHQLVKDACWKSFDYLDCMQHCELPNRHHLTKSSRLLKNKCRPFIEGEESQLACISRFHSFLEVRCSTYLNEAIRLSKLGIKMKHDTCRYLHYHNLCLANNIFHFCPKANNIFTRLNLRDYFISFLLPEDDQYFSEDYLDDCQIYDFVKAAEAVHDTTESNQMDSVTPYLETNEDDYVSRVTHPDELLPDVYSTSPITTTAATTQNALVTATISLETITPIATTTKKLFSPERDLQFTPPNFFYSSLRSSTLRAAAHGDLYAHGTPSEDDMGVITLPVRIDFTQQLDDYSHEGHEDEHDSKETLFTTPIPHFSVTQPWNDEIWTPSSPRQFYKTSAEDGITSNQNNEVTQKRTSFDDGFGDMKSFVLTTARPELSSTLSQSPAWPLHKMGTSSKQSAELSTQIKDSEEEADYDQHGLPMHHGASHRTAADELSYPSVFAVTPHPATVSPKGDVYTELNYDSDSDESFNSEETTETRIFLQTSTHQKPSSEDTIHPSLLRTLDDLEMQFTTASTTPGHSGEVVYVHEADAELEQTSLTSENLATVPSVTITSAVPYGAHTEATEQVQQTKPAWDEPEDVSYTSAEGIDSKEMNGDLETAISDKPMHIKHSSSEESKSPTSKSHPSDFTKRPPMFGGRRIHVKPIRSWREPINDDNTAAEQGSGENAHSGQVLRKRTKASAKGTDEASPPERHHHWDLIHGAPANRHLIDHSEIPQSDYDDTLQLTEPGFEGNGDVWDETAISEIQNETSDPQGDGEAGDFLPNDHGAIMLFIYVTLVSVALLTVVALLVALAVRRYFV